MPTDTDTGTCTVGNGPFAVFVQLLGYVAQLVAATKRGLPGIAVHGEILELLEVYDELAIFATHACS